MPSFAHIKPLLIALLFVGSAIAGYVWLWHAVERMGDGLLAQVQLIENQEAFDTEYAMLLDTVESSTEQRAKLETFILNGEDDTITLLSELDVITQNYGVEIATQQLQEIEQTGDFNQLDVSFSLTGPEEQVVALVQLFETLPYHGRVTSLSMQRTVSEDTASTMKASISLLLTIARHD